MSRPQVSSSPIVATHRPAYSGDSSPVSTIGRARARRSAPRCRSSARGRRGPARPSRPPRATHAEDVHALVADAHDAAARRSPTPTPRSRAAQPRRQALDQRGEQDEENPAVAKAGRADIPGQPVTMTIAATPITPRAPAVVRRARNTCADRLVCGRHLPVIGRATCRSHPGCANFRAGPTPVEHGAFSLDRGWSSPPIITYRRGPSRLPTSSTSPDRTVTRATPRPVVRRGVLGGTASRQTVKLPRTGEYAGPCLRRPCSISAPTETGGGCGFPRCVASRQPSIPRSVSRAYGVRVRRADVRIMRPPDQQDPPERTGSRSVPCPSGPRPCLVLDARRNVPAVSPLARRLRPPRRRPRRPRARAVVGVGRRVRRYPTRRRRRPRAARSTRTATASTASRCPARARRPLRTAR